MNKQISPGQIPHLVRLVADLFRTMREETKSPNNNPGNKLVELKNMHFVADLLKDLVNTAYPIETPMEDELQGPEIEFVHIDKSTPLTYKALLEFLEKVEVREERQREGGF